MTITRKDLLTTAHILGLIGNDLDNAWNHFAAERAAINGYATTHSGEPTSRTNTIPDPTAAMAGQLEHLRRELDYIDASLNVIIVNTNEVAHALRKVIGTRIAVPQCDGRGLQGFDQWGDACTDPATKAGLCAKHYMRSYRWRRDHGLQPLTDDT